MPADLFQATAITTQVEPGSENQKDGRLVVRNRMFTDFVRCEDRRIAGVNRPIMNLEIDLETMGGTVDGRFVLTPSSVDGHWEGEVVGTMTNGIVSAQGVGSGVGSLAGALLRIDFQQVEELDEPLETEEPLALYKMNGMIATPR